MERGSRRQLIPRSGTPRLGGRRHFFQTLWPVVAADVTTRFAADARVDVASLLRWLRLPPRARILDIPCGYGRHSLELARRGFQVTGVDISARLLAQARRQAASEGLHIEFRRADMRQLRYRRRLDLVLNLFTSFGYFGEAADVQVLKTFHRSLRPGGRLVVDVINRDWAIRHMPPKSRVRLGRIALTQTRHFDFGSSTAVEVWLAQQGRSRWQSAIRYRLYSGHELVGLAEAAGFRRAQVFGGLRGQPLTWKSRRLVLLARR
ncbi:MAG: class I SAM-dependent methyltransferase [Acidobacteria bacterium]|nr:class I SAM-dependent methyltransferase [Acidobacteriota bacterium]